MRNRSQVFAFNSLVASVFRRHKFVVESRAFCADSERFMTPTNLKSGAESVEFCTPNRLVKQGFLLVATFPIIGLVSDALHRGQNWRDALWFAVPLSLLLLSAIWLYGVFQMFDRRYVISTDGVSLFRRERLLEHIAWSEVRSIRRGQLEIRARCGRRIAFNLPWRIQWRALDAIERYRGFGPIGAT